MCLARLSLEAGFSDCCGSLLTVRLLGGVGEIVLDGLPRPRGAGCVAVAAIAARYTTAESHKMIFTGRRRGLIAIAAAMNTAEVASPNVSRGGSAKPTAAGIAQG